MSEKSSIEWTDSTWNPVTGCTKVSPGCTHCYAETFAERFRGVPGHPYEQGFDLRVWRERFELPLRWKSPRNIFVNSMSDLFHRDIPDEVVETVFETMRRADWHTFQVLTKRPERMRDFVTDRAARGLAPNLVQANTWLGTSVESQDFVPRAKAIRDLPVSVRFLSCEPLLGPLDLREVLDAGKGINWVIVGGESGHGARPMDRDWVLDIQKHCAKAGVPFFFKQWGGRNKKKAGRMLEGRTWDEKPARGTEQAHRGQAW
jgi:protein gp37